MLRAVLLGFCSLLVSVSLFAQIPQPIQIIPIVGKTKGGQGTDWITDLSLANLGTTAGTVGIRYFPAGTANTFDGTFPKTVALQPGRSTFVKDVVGTWFPQFGASTSGFLLLADMTTPAHCELEDPPLLGIVATSRTYNNADPKKTYGQTVPDALFRMNFTREPSVIIGIRHQPGVIPGARTNAGVVNLSTVAISVRGTVFNDSGQSVGTAVKSVPPMSLAQWSLSDFGVATLASGRIEFRLESGVIVDPCEQADDPPACLSRCEDGCNGRYAFSRSAAFIPWASKVDNGSGDAEFLLSAVDWLRYDSECTATGSSPIVKLMQGFGFGPPPSLTIRKLPRRQ
jgi:hypothetical protein